MIWRYTLTDRNGTAYIIDDEPVGWDTASMTLQRDRDTHGISFTFTANSLEFHGQAYWLLKEEYNLYGADGLMKIIMEWKCEDCPTFDLYSQGNLNFLTFKEHCGSECWASCGYDESNKAVLLKNRQDTNVDLGSALAYDGITTLDNYPGLSKIITIPSKAIFQQSKAATQNTDGIATYSLLTDADYMHAQPDANNRYFNTNDGVILPKLNNTSIQELADFAPQFANDYLKLSDAYTATEIFKVNNDSGLVLTNAYNVSLRLKGSLYFKYSFGSGSGSTPLRGGSVDVRLGLKLQYSDAHTDAFPPVTFEEYLDSQIASGVSFEHTINFDYSWNGAITLAPAQKVFLFFTYKGTESSQGPFAPITVLQFSLTEDSFFTINSATTIADSPCKVFLLHETGARVVESITNNQLTFKSGHYGRKDSQPVAFDVDGCGSLKALTNGLLLRRALLQDSSSPNPFLSWKQFYNDQNATDCIGYGIEGNYVRMEPVDYFYRKQIVFVADGVYEYDRDVLTNRIWNAFRFGYDKYETESTNGLDAIHTKREYRTSIVNSDQSLEQYCKTIYDGYAIEATRRKYGTTDDWRYDQNIFGLCLKRGTTDMVVEQGNITGAANLFDPPTVINFRVTPLRNAMRWFRWIMQGVRNLTSARQMLFNSGEGNYVAKGELNSDSCRMENGIIAENAPVGLNSFEDAEAAKPFIVPETVTFSYPLGLHEFVSLKKQMYGLIQFRGQNTEDWQYGWIDKVEPDHEAGLAKFTLITSTYDGPPLENVVGLATEDYVPISNEGGDIISAYDNG